jgi:hypothetical protein
MLRQLQLVGELMASAFAWSISKVAFDHEAVLMGITAALLGCGLTYLLSCDMWDFFFGDIG